MFASVSEAFELGAVAMGTTVYSARSIHGARFKSYPVLSFGKIDPRLTQSAVKGKRERVDTRQ